MDDLISRQAAIAHAISGRTREFEGEKWIRVSEVRESLQTMPSVQPEQKKGKWIINEDDEHISGTCSCCGWDALLYETDVVRMPFCPNCGARMEED